MTTTAAELAALKRVQRRVAGIAFFSIAIHGVLGLIGGAHAIVDDPGRRTDAILLLVMSGVFAVVTLVVTRVILGRSPFTWYWWPVAFVPTIAGSFWVL
ncbi:hypothetical protein HMPREF0063_12678 [Aeromicrobium marinum DSM 15272]|uniref:Uncharacterized protein n=1 Tax=Aeromicrobium marinum DSM 15272 TaxID=585531 RepID=E2SF69_9ACTN|nr:hypothetical protein [Aeromicrobium marinum]EFQ82154.1 hypothetical protein HMPREF0063_12678 [Aeromicrobium marinum DSM 15272]